MMLDNGDSDMRSDEMGPIPNPQSPIPQSPIPNIDVFIILSNKIN